MFNTPIAAQAFKAALTTERRKLQQLWRKFWRAMDTVPRDQAKINQLRKQMPPGDLSWPFWDSIGCRRDYMRDSNQ